MNPTMSKLSKYSQRGFFKLLFDLIRTRLFYSKSRLIRFPFYIRGQRNINLGSSLTTGVGVRIDAFTDGVKKIIQIGNNVQLNDYVHIAAIDSVVIEDDVLIASGVFISDHNHGDFNGPTDASVLLPPAQRPLTSKPVRIEQSVWIGEHVCILPGVTIGKNAIIGAGSVVTKNVPAWSLAVGNPAAVIKKYDTATSRWVPV